MITSSVLGLQSDADDDDDVDDQPKEVHEDVDDVQVDGERGKDVLLGGDCVLVVPADHHLNEWMNEIRTRIVVVVE